MADQTSEPDALEHLRENWRAKPYFQQGNQPMPHDESKTRFVDAGVLRIGIEHRVLDTEAVNRHFDAQGVEDNAGFGGSTRGRQFEDQGFSLHVFGTDDGFEYLRFDCFGEDPHYHYIVPGLDGVVKLSFDPVANGNIVDWVLDRLRDRLPAMLRNAGAFELANEVDEAIVTDALGEVENLMRDRTAA